MEIDRATIEVLAEAAHNVWMGGKIADGWEYDPVTDKTNKKHSCLLPYSGLEEVDKDSDRDFVRGIPAIVEKAGYAMVNLCGHESFPDLCRKIERLEAELMEFKAYENGPVKA